MSSKKKMIQTEQKQFEETYDELNKVSNGSYVLDLINQVLTTSKQFLQGDVKKTYLDAQKEFKDLMKQTRDAQMLRAQILQPLTVCADIIERYLILKNNAILLILYLIDQISSQYTFSFDRKQNDKILSAFDADAELFYLSKLSDTLICLNQLMKPLNCGNDLMVLKRNVPIAQFSGTVYVKQCYGDPRMQQEFTGDGAFETLGAAAALKYTAELNIDRGGKQDFFSSEVVSLVNRRAAALVALGDALMCHYGVTDGGVFLTLMASEFLAEIERQKLEAKGGTDLPAGLLAKNLKYDLQYVVDVAKGRSAMYDAFCNHLIRMSQAKSAANKIIKKL